MPAAKTWVVDGVGESGLQGHTVDRLADRGRHITAAAGVGVTALYGLPLSGQGIPAHRIVDQEAGASAEAGVGAEVPGRAKKPMAMTSAATRDHTVDRRVGPGLAQVRYRIVTNQRAQATASPDHQASLLDNNATTPLLTQQGHHCHHYPRNLQVEMGSCPYTIPHHRQFPTLIQFRIHLGMARCQFLHRLRRIIKDIGHHLRQWVVHHLRIFIPGPRHLHLFLVPGHLLRLRRNNSPPAKAARVAITVCREGEVVMEEVMGDGNEGMILYWDMRNTRSLLVHDREIGSQRSGQDSELNSRKYSSPLS